jgi:hypothetical protein
MSTEKPVDGDGGSIGAQRVRESFNPSGNVLVDKIKRYTADLLDLCAEEVRREPDGEVGRLWHLALDRYEEAAMWAVKGATAPKPR